MAVPFQGLFASEIFQAPELDGLIHAASGEKVLILDDDHVHDHVTVPVVFPVGVPLASTGVNVPRVYPVILPRRVQNFRPRVPRESNLGLALENVLENSVLEGISAMNPPGGELRR